jgi:exodeoxyribonuclease-3
MRASTALGFTHRLVRGMKGYNGVAVLSRLPISLRADDPDWCAKDDCRHLGVMLDAPGGPVEAGQFLCARRRRYSGTAEANPKFGHKLDFVAEATRWFAGRGARRAVLVGDLNIAPLNMMSGPISSYWMSSPHTPIRG